MASETVVVPPHPDTPEEQVEKKVVEDVKPDVTIEKIVPQEVEEVVTPAEPVPLVAEEKPIEAPPVTVVEEEKPVADPVVEGSIETVLKTLETPAVEDAIKTGDATETIEEEKSVGTPLVELEDAAEPVLEEKVVVVPPVEEVIKAPEPVEEENPVPAQPVLEPVAVPSVEKVVKPKEEVAPVEEEKPVAAPAVEEFIKTEDLAGPVEEEVIKTENVTEPVEEQKPVAPAAVEDIKTEATAEPVEEEKPVEVPAADEVVKTETTEVEKPVAVPTDDEVVETETIKEEQPVTAPVVEEILITDVLVEEDKQTTAPAVEQTAEPVKEESPAIAPVVEVAPKVAPIFEVIEAKLEAGTPDVPEPVVSEAVEKLVETPTEVIEKSERALEPPTVEQLEKTVPAAIIEPEAPLVEENVVEPVAVVEEKTKEFEPPTTLVAETIKEAVSAAEVLEPVKAQPEAVSETNKLEETSAPVETSTGRTLADKLTEEKTTDSQQVQEPPKSNFETDDKEPAAAQKLEETSNSAEPITEAIKTENDTKTDRELPAEVETKTVPKQSNNLLSKVKKSLVKAKKAIIGKSPGSKNPPPVTNEDLEVK